MTWKPIGVPLHTEEDADILAWLNEQPSKGRALRELIRAAFRGGNPQTVSPDAQLLADTLKQGLADLREAIREQQPIVVTAATNGNGQHPAPVGEGMEDPRDPLVQRFAGLSFEDTNWG